MLSRIVRWIALTFLALIVPLCSTWQARAEDAKAPYSEMAPIDQYLMERSAEIALARSAAPESISRDAEVMVLGRSGYEVAVAGKNGFVCMVERSWTAAIDFPQFWNPKIRGAICFNPQAVRTYLPLTIKKTEWVLAGQSKAEMFASLEAAFQHKELPTPEFGAMCYMMSKQSYLNDKDPHWHPHLMFFLPLMKPDDWGAPLPDTPVAGDRIPTDRLTMFLIPVTRWSDGTVAPPL